MSGASDAFEAGWRALVTNKGQYLTPGDLPAEGWIAADVPGTLAAALAAQKMPPVSLAEHDVWYRCTLNEEGPRILAFESLTPLAEVWLDDRPILESRSMFVRHEIETVCAGQQTLTIRFTTMTMASPPRARWRASVVADQTRRLVRATLLGQMPQWTPAVEAIGPWRAITCRKPLPVELVSAKIAAKVMKGGGRVTVKVHLRGASDAPVLHCRNHSTALIAIGDGWFSGELDLPTVDAWWPHTHGAQPLYALSLTTDAISVDLGCVGFRDIQVDHGQDGKGFGLVVNGVPIFCRGANWVSTDMIGLKGDRATYEPILTLARDAGMNMLRLSGVGAYETADFYALCDELGIMVWQDFMFCSFDYPIADPGFAGLVEQEAKDLFDRLAGRPSVAVLCGGSETLQQGAMWGLPESRIASALSDELLPRLCAEALPEVPYVRNSPSGGSLPFVADEGVSHYYGVGAYRRPISDARHSNIRFATECLGFSNLPQPSMPLPSPDSPDWDVVGPRDVGADWTFADVRDFYLASLLGAEPQSLRRDNPILYADLSRAASGEAMSQVFAEWRRPASSCNGALVWTLQDLAPGGGFGLIDSTGEPKPCWYDLKRAFQPVQVAITDEGLNGLGIHITNETAQPLAFELDVRCLRNGSVSVAKAKRAVDLAPRSAVTLSAFEVIGAFLDISYAYRFGPPGHDATVATLRHAETGDIISQAFHFPTGVKAEAGQAQLTAELVEDLDGWALSLNTSRLVRHLHIDDKAFRPADDWFTVAPGFSRMIRLAVRPGAKGRPVGRVLAPGGIELATYG